MHHIAIMSKKWDLIPMILDGRKTIESRWYKARTAPWGRITTGDIVYFKDAGEPVTAMAKVEKVLQYDELDKDKVLKIYDQYVEALGLSREEIEIWAPDKAGKKYCILIFLKNPKRIEPFEINKQGFGMSSAWLVVDDVERIKR